MKAILKILILSLIVVGPAFAQGAGPNGVSLTFDPSSSGSPPHLVCVTYPIGSGGEFLVCTYPDGTVHGYLMSGGEVVMYFPSLEALCDYVSHVINYLLEVIQKEFEKFYKCLEGPNPNLCIPPDTSDEQQIIDLFSSISLNHCYDYGSGGNIE